MPTYVCPRCGRSVVKPKGTYYCKICRATMVQGKVVGKVYLVESWIAGAELYDRIGVFATYESAKRAADKWWEKHKDLGEGFEPAIEELAVIE